MAIPARADPTPGKNPAAIVAGDLDSDGRLDLAVANTTDKSVGVLMGNGDGTFQSPVASATGIFPDRILIVDFDPDGKKDLAVSGPGGIDFLLGNGDGTFRQGPNAIAGFLGGFPVVGDFNGDSRLDLVRLSCWFLPHPGCAYSRWLGNGDGIPIPISLTRCERRGRL
jgi:hypothetical protein